jgi:hypothetical protein
MSDATVESIVAEAQSKRKFKFTDILRDRVAARDTVVIYPSASDTYPIMAMVAEIGIVDVKIEDAEGKAKLALIAERNVLSDKIRKHYASIDHNKVTLTIQGVTSGFREDALDEAILAHPYEYEDGYSELTGEKAKIQKDNPLANKLFSNLMWKGHIVKAEGFDWEQDGFSLEEVATMRRELPEAATSSIVETMTKVDMAVDWFKIGADEGFLAKR